MSSNDLPVAAGTRSVYIGPPKTGTSALQSALRMARERPAQHSVLYPGTGRHPMAAVHAVTERPPNDGPRQAERQRLDASGR